MRTGGVEAGFLLIVLLLLVLSKFLRTIREQEQEHDKEEEQTARIVRWIVRGIGVLLRQP
jgi:hypothetical protein